MRAATALIEAKLEASHGIHINVKHQDFVKQILSGEKTMETRDTDSLKPYVGKKVGIIATGIKGDRYIHGHANIESPVIYKNSKRFNKDYEKHRVGAESSHHLNNSKNKEKYGYPLSSITALKKPIKLEKGNNGNRVARKLSLANKD